MESSLRNCCVASSCAAGSSLATPCTIAGSDSSCSRGGPGGEARQPSPGERRAGGLGPARRREGGAWLALAGPERGLPAAAAGWGGRSRVYRTRMGGPRVESAAKEVRARAGRTSRRFFSRFSSFFSFRMAKAASSRLRRDSSASSVWGGGKVAGGAERGGGGRLAAPCACVAAAPPVAARRGVRGGCQATARAFLNSFLRSSARLPGRSMAAESLALDVRESPRTRAHGSKHAFDASGLRATGGGEGRCDDDVVIPQFACRLPRPPAFLHRAAARRDSGAFRVGARQ